jgi:hypothetical protein
MQNDATVGRVLLASLHQAIAEVLPERLEFYERWLTPWPASRVLGVASFTAMLSYLQREDGAADAVTARAGQYAAVRAFGRLNVLERAFLRTLPRRLRARRAIRILVQLLPALYPETRLDTIRRGRTVFVGIDESPFCVARGPEDRPTCSFYASTVTTFLQLLDLRPSVRISRCRSTGAKSCLLMVIPHQGAGAERGILDLADGVIEISASESTPVEDATPVETAAAGETPAPNEPVQAVPITTQEDTTSTPETAPAIEATPSIEVTPSVEATPSVQATPPVDATQPVDATRLAESTQPPEVSQPAETSTPRTIPANIEEAPVTVSERESVSPEGEPSPDASAASHAVPGAAHEGSEAPAKPQDFAARWMAIAAKRTSPRPRPNVEALFTRPMSPGEDSETPWHRL